MIGNLTRDVEVVTTTNNITMAKFTIAIKRPHATANGEEHCDFINVVAWRQLGESCAKYLSKGKKCAVTGLIQTRNYDAQDGTKKFIVEVVADEVEFLTPKGNNDKPADGGDKITPIESNEELPFADDDNLPF